MKATNELKSNILNLIDELYDLDEKEAKEFIELIYFEGVENNE